MNSVIFICPYFGRLPESNMPLWLLSCGKNPDIDWWIITDNEVGYECPKNVKITYMTLEEFRKKAEARFGKEMSLTAPYKLCDYKPVYGFLFEEEIKNYDFWGHCDLSDTIFGDLRKFLTDEAFQKNDKILFLGHMTLYRNSREVNRRFMLKTKAGVDIWDILNNEENMAFDEIKPYSINTIYEEYGFPMLRLDEMYTDVAADYFRFMKSSYDKLFKRNPCSASKRIFCWKDGHLYDCRDEKGCLMQKEIGYVHFQKRKMKNRVTDFKKGFYIVPNKFIDCDEDVSIDLIQKYSKGRIVYLPFFINKAKALRYRIKHIGRAYL